VSNIVTFILENIDKIILFSCLVGWLNSSPVGILKKQLGVTFKNCLGLWREYQHMRAKILGTLCLNGY